MFSKSVELYDLIYSRIKDYDEESRRISKWLRRVHPEASTLLDVGCGTGEHARLLAEQHGYRVDGLDIEPGFVRLAREKCPEGRFHGADMRNFRLQTRYDAVLCLFSSIGYLTELPEVTGALSAFRRHLEPGGVVLVEPWIDPDDWYPGRVFLHTAESDELSVCRMSHSGLRGRISVVEFHYLVGRGTGIEHFRETHELGLFTREELEACFVAAGLRVVEYDPEGITGRGLFVARVEAGEPAPEVDSG